MRTFFHFLFTSFAFMLLAFGKEKEIDPFLSSMIHHKIIDFTPHHSIKTENGAEWIFDETESSILCSWKKGDMIVLSVKEQWLGESNYPFVLVNKKRKTSISANLFTDPDVFGEHTQWIGGIDHKKKQIYLHHSSKKSSVWEIAHVDQEIFNGWNVNDPLLIGLNDSWLWILFPYNYILINVEKKQWVRTRPLSINPNFIKSQ